MINNIANKMNTAFAESRFTKKFTLQQRRIMLLNLQSKHIVTPKKIEDFVFIVTQPTFKLFEKMPENSPSYRFLMANKSMNMNKLRQQIRSTNKISGTEMLALSCNGQLLTQADTKIKDIYEKHKNIQDGFLYIQYNKGEAF